MVSEWPISAESVFILNAKRQMLLVTLAKSLFTHATTLTYFTNLVLNEVISKSHFFRYLCLFQELVKHCECIYNEILIMDKGKPSGISAYTTTLTLYLPLLFLRVGAFNRYSRI